MVPIFIELTMKYKSLSEFLDYVKKTHPGQEEFHQAVHEVVSSIWPFIETHTKYAEHSLLDRLVEPERIVIFRVSWVDDAGEVHVNRGYRVQHNSAIGPYKGGLRFHPSVNLGILKFLAFEQTFKNALTTLPMGGGKGGSDFDPRGKSSGEIMRFCQAFVSELFRHLGKDTDVPAGDIGVGAREIGYMVGMVKKITNDSSCVFTGKGMSYGGSLIRPEATGFGLVYFVEEMLNHAKNSLEGMRVGISGSGNVAQFALEKCLQMGAKVVTVSDSGGTVVDEEGINFEKWEILKDIKNNRYGRIRDYAKETKATYLEGEKPWNVPMDVALPCATQNELDEISARQLVKNGVISVGEGANMPTTNDAVRLFESSGVLYAPGKAANAGGVATSGLEMSQNSMRLPWTRNEVDDKLQSIMKGIHNACLEYGTDFNNSKDGKNRVSYSKGANIAGFVKVAEAMLAQGIL